MWRLHKPLKHKCRVFILSCKHWGPDRALGCPSQQVVDAWGIQFGWWHTLSHVGWFCSRLVLQLSRRR